MIEEYGGLSVASAAAFLPEFFFEQVAYGAAYDAASAWVHVCSDEFI